MLETYVPAADYDQLKRERNEARRGLAERIVYDLYEGATKALLEVTPEMLRRFSDSRWGPGTGAHLFPDDT